MSYELHHHLGGSFDNTKQVFEPVDSSAIRVEPFTTQLDPKMGKGVWRKLDLWLLPTVAMFYLLSFMVRQISIVNNSGVLSLSLCRIELILPTPEWLDCKNIWE